MIHLGVVEDIQKLLPSLDLVQGNGHDVSVCVVGNSLDGRRLSTAGLTVKQKSHGIGNAASFVPSLVFVEEIYSVYNVVFFWKENIAE